MTNHDKTVGELIQLHGIVAFNHGVFCERADPLRDDERIDRNELEDGLRQRFSTLEAALEEALTDYTRKMRDMVTACGRDPDSGMGPLQAADDLRSDLEEAQQTTEDTRESLEQALTAIRKFGKEGDDYGGFHLAVCITELGFERDEARAHLEEARKERVRAVEQIHFQRRELGLAYEIIDALDDEALDKVPEAKLIAQCRLMSEADKRTDFETFVDALTTERDTLRTEAKRLREGADLVRSVFDEENATTADSHPEGVPVWIIYQGERRSMLEALSPPTDPETEA